MYNLSNQGRFPTLADMISFLEFEIRKVNCIRRVDPGRSNIRALYTETAPADHLFCPLHNSKSHNLDNCVKFLPKSYDDKMYILKYYKLCFLCLGNHMRKHCKYVPKCSVCEGSHNSALHQDRGFASGDLPVNDENSKTRQSESRGGKGGRGRSTHVSHRVGRFDNDNIGVGQSEDRSCGRYNGVSFRENSRESLDRNPKSD